MELIFTTTLSSTQIFKDRLFDFPSFSRELVPEKPIASNNVLFDHGIKSTHSCHESSLISIIFFQVITTLLFNHAW